MSHVTDAATSSTMKAIKTLVLRREKTQLPPRTPITLPSHARSRSLHLGPRSMSLTPASDAIRTASQMHSPGPGSFLDHTLISPSTGTKFTPRAAAHRKHDLSHHQPSPRLLISSKAVHHTKHNSLGYLGSPSVRHNPPSALALATCLNSLDGPMHASFKRTRTRSSCSVVLFPGMLDTDVPETAGCNGATADAPVAMPSAVRLTDDVFAASRASARQRWARTLSTVKQLVSAVRSQRMQCAPVQSVGLNVERQRAAHVPGRSLSIDDAVMRRLNMTTTAAVSASTVSEAQLAPPVSRTSPQSCPTVSSPVSSTTDSEGLAGASSNGSPSREHRLLQCIADEAQTYRLIDYIVSVSVYTDGDGSMYNSGYQGGHVDGGFDGDDNVDHSHSGSDEPRANGSSSSAQVSVQRFPPVDHSDFALPQNLHAFALAPGPYTRTEAGETSAEFRHSNCGCVVKTSPTLFSFVLTDSDNNKVYVTCAHFYECVSNDGGATAHAVTVNGGSNLSGDDNTTSEQPQAKHAVARPQWLARALCVVSHYPFFTAFSQTLSALWLVSGSLVDCHCQALQSATWSTPERVIYRVCHFALERCSGDFYSIAIVKFMHLVCVHCLLYTSPSPRD